MRFHEPRSEVFQLFSALSLRKFPCSQAIIVGIPATPRVSMQRSWVVAYDAKCGPCTSFKRAVGFLDPKRRIAFIPLAVAVQNGCSSRFLPPEGCRSFHAILPDGTVYERCLGAPGPPLIATTRTPLLELRQVRPRRHEGARLGLRHPLEAPRLGFLPRPVGDR